MKPLKWLTFISILLIICNIAGCAPSYEKIVFQSNRDGAYGFYVMNADGSDQRQLSSYRRVVVPSYLTNAYPAIPSPDGRRIAIEIEGMPGKIEVVNIESGARLMLTKNNDNGYEPTWSPDGKYIAFKSDRDSIVLDANRGLSTNNIYIMNADGTDVRRLTVDNTIAYYGTLSWSPDGSKLAFDMSSQGMQGGFYDDGIQILTLSNRKIISVSHAATPSKLGGNPTWSPDGKHILFWESGEMSVSIHVMNADGTNQVALSNDSLGIALSAVWSPDGKHVAFVTQKSVGDQTCIYTVNTDGTGLVSLSKATLNYDTSPSWSPDGKYIVFASARDSGKSHLYIMNADGTNQRRLTNGPGEEAAPIWLPIQ